MADPPGWNLLHTLRAHTAPIGRMAWSMDGTRIATPGGDGMVIIWDAAEGRPLRLIRHPGPANAAAFSPDGQRVAVAFEDSVGPLDSSGYEPFGEQEDPLPPEVDQLLGDYAVSTDWDPNPDAPPGVRLPIRVSDAETGQLEAAFYSEQLRAVPEDIAWSADGRWLVTASTDGLGVWQVRTGQLVHLLRDEGPVSSLAFSPDGDQVAGSTLSGWAVWDHAAAELRQVGGHVDSDYTALAWSDRGSVALGTVEGTIEVVVPGGTAPVRFLEGHTDYVSEVTFSRDGALLASKSLDGTVRLWDTASWEALASLREPARGQGFLAGVGFSPTDDWLATLGPAGRVARLWVLDHTTIATRREVAPTTHYANAKVVLVGDSGVGKTGLGLVLAGQPFRPTESSHGRNVWLIDVDERGGEKPERRETYLWDLAGQPGYRILHQLHLGDVALAVVLFDARSEVDPFAGVRHWIRALRQAEREGEEPIPRVLVAARTDRGGPAVSEGRIQAALNEYGIDTYVSTSAKEGRGVNDLYEAILAGIDWHRIPKVSSTGLFDSIKAFLASERDRARLLMTVEDLLNSYAETQEGSARPDDLREEFETCVGRVAARGLIRRLSFGGLVLLRPEVLDSYAAALVNAAREQPDATGSISEDSVRNGEFDIPKDERLANRDLERLLLAATVEEVLRHEVALREHSDEGPYLVFPTQSRIEAPRLEDPDRVWLTVTFEGPVQHVYATLVVRLAHSGIFQREATYREAATFRWKESVLGVAISEAQEGKGTLRLFLQGAAEPAAQGWFADYVVAHIGRRAVRDSIVIDAAVRCPECSLEVTQQMLVLARDRGRETLTCPVCDTSIEVPSPEAESVNELVVRKMDDSADAERNRSAASATLAAKEEVGEFDVFLAYNSEDTSAVAQIADNLRATGLNPWLDDEQVPPGRWFQDVIQQAIGQVHSAAIIIGKGGLGKWEIVELRAFIQECLDRDLFVIPVLLPGAAIPQELRFLRQFGWVRFEESVAETDALMRLRWGITGERPLRPVATP